MALREVGAMKNLQLNEKIKLSITEIGLSSNICKKLNESEVYTLEDLCDLSEIELIKIKSLGKKSINEIKSKLDLFDLRLSNVPEVQQIESLNLSERVFNSLKRAGINTVDDLNKINDKNLFKIRGIGIKSFNEIKRKKSK